MPLWSLTYRFGGAALILITYCLIANKNMRFNSKQHAWIALQACFVYFINYVLFYLASHYFVSGIVAVLFASIIMWNIINGRLFLKSKIVHRTLYGAIIGLAGLLCIMWAEVARLEDKDFWFLLEGIALGCAGALCASFGQITTMANVRRGLPILQTNALGYAYASVFMIIVALIFGHPMTFDFSLSYVSSLLYLSLFGTVIAFLCYLNLIDRIGSDKGAYVFILTPVIALLLSSLYEDLSWSVLTIFGLIFIVIGNVLVMTKSSSGVICPEPANQQAVSLQKESIADNA